MIEKAHFQFVSGRGDLKYVYTLHTHVYNIRSILNLTHKISYIRIVHFLRLLHYYVYNNHNFKGPIFYFFFAERPTILRYATTFNVLYFVTTDETEHYFTFGN